jgi:ribosomal protein L13
MRNKLKGKAKQAAARDSIIRRALIRMIGKKEPQSTRAMQRLSALGGGK